MTVKLSRKQAIDYLLVMVGTILFSYAIIAFWAPHNLVTGGVSGIAIIVLNYSERLLGFPVPVWLTNLVLNIPLFIIGYKFIPRKHLFRSAFATGFMTIALFIVEFLPVPETDLLLGSVFGGVICGFGVGLVLRSQATTGGSSLAAVILKRVLFRQYSIAKVMFALDVAIIMIGLMVFGPIAAMYAIIAIFVVTKVTELITEGLNFGKAAFIITSKADEISTAVLRDISRGCTRVSSVGMFTKQEMPMLICVLSPKELIALKEVVYAIDERAFVFVADVKEVLGEGFVEGKESM